MQNYKDLKVWEKAHALTLKVYEVTKLFPRDELYSLTNQIRRSASSIPANIAEGMWKKFSIRVCSFFKYFFGICK